MATIRQAALDDGVDPSVVFAESAAGLGELGNAAALGSRAPAVKQFGDSGRV
jgi:hypothetical protein